MAHDEGRSGGESTGMNTASGQDWILDRWIACFTHALETVAGERPVVRVHSQPFDVPAAQQAILWSERFSAGTDIEMATIASQETWQELGQLAIPLSETEPPALEAAREAFVGILRQTNRKFAGEMGERLGIPVSCEGKDLEKVPEPAIRLEVELSSGTYEVGISPSSHLVKIMSQTESALQTTGVGQSRTLDLLLDVELPVSISFGRAQVPLKDVIRLTSGSIVELNRTVSEPVEVIVNNCVIARGEVVVVEGNYGIRIQEIVSRQERLRTLN